jgi:cyanate permease
VNEQVIAPGASRSPQYRVYGYRWVVLGVFMLANLAIQILWIGYATIISQAAGYYHVSHQLITLLAIVFMIAFIPLSLPAAWVIDTRGYRVAVGFGVVMMAVFGITRGLAGPNYTLALLSTIGIAIAQPFLLDSWTKLPANWFPASERATAVGLITLASMLGVAVGIALSGLLVNSMSIGTMQLMFGVIAAVSAVAFLAFTRERPATPPDPSGVEVRALMLEGLKHALTVKPFLIILGVAFVVMSVFNGVTSWVGDIILPRGFGAADASVLGSVMLIAGVIGAVVMSAFSDRQKRRIRFLVLALSLAVPSLVGVAFLSSAWLLYASGAALGFFVVSALPIGMQYAAEVTRPTPEGTSNGLVQLVGQCSAAYVWLMGVLRTSDGSFAVSLVLAAALMAVSAVVVSRLKDVPPAGQLAAGRGSLGEAAPLGAGATRPGVSSSSLGASTSGADEPSLREPAP